MMIDIKAQAAEEAAKLLDATWRFGIPVEPVFIAKALGIRVVDAPLGERTMGVLINKPGEDPTIMINQTDSDSRRRFTCAHELGHWVKRADVATEYSTVDLRNPLSATGQDPDEVFANQFAACLLMPEEAVRQFVGYEYGALEMGLQFNVSRDAMEYRLKGLGFG
jgi:Zn-dependent peptidase ImmA (M78 family)